jgi:hypothetical protein
VVLRVLGKDLLTIHPPEQPGAPVRLCGQFFDADGKESLLIEDNEIVLSTGKWDLETNGTKEKGGRAIIRNGPRDIALDLSIVPRRRVVINRLEMCYQGVQISIDNGRIRIGRVGRPAPAVELEGQTVRAECCIDVVEQGNRDQFFMGGAIVSDGTGRVADCFSISCDGPSLLYAHDGLCIAFGTNAHYAKISMAQLPDKW